MEDNPIRTYKGAITGNDPSLQYCTGVLRMVDFDYESIIAFEGDSTVTAW